MVSEHVDMIKQIPWVNIIDVIKMLLEWAEIPQA
jgi:hypothetical protein